MRVLVTDGDNRAALAVVRALGRRGHQVLVGARTVPSLAQTSRYCSGRIRYPDPSTASGAFVGAVEEAVHVHRPDVLLPIADITTVLLAKERDRFEPACSLPLPDISAIQRAADKVETLRSAQRLGVAVPATVVVQSPEAVPSLPFSFPVVVKPRRSRNETPKGWLSSSVSYAADREGLVRDLAGRPSYDFPLMLQERIPGEGVGVFACYHKGHPIALFSHRRLRERPPWGGVSVLSESIAMCSVAKDMALRLLDDLGWHGVAMVEFKRDSRDGVPRLMEINGRFWGSLQLAIDAGVDFPALLVDATRHGTVARQEPYRVGLLNRWFWGDVDSLLVTLFGGRGAPALAEAGPSKFSATVDFLRLWRPNQRYENPRLDDIWPGLFESYAWFRRILWDDRLRRRHQRKS